MKIISLSQCHNTIDVNLFGSNNTLIPTRTRIKATVLVKNDEDMNMIKNVEPIIDLSSMTLITDYYVSCVAYSLENYKDRERELAIEVTELFYGDQVHQYVDELMKFVHPEFLTKLKIARLVKILIETNQPPKHVRKILKLMQEIEDD